jgi:hypothetical protein
MSRAKVSLPVSVASDLSREKTVPLGAAEEKVALRPIKSAKNKKALISENMAGEIAGGTFGEKVVTPWVMCQRIASFHSNECLLKNINNAQCVRCIRHRYRHRYGVLHDGVQRRDWQLRVENVYHGLRESRCRQSPVRL